MDKRKELKKLLDKHQQGKSSNAEKNILSSWLHNLEKLTEGETVFKSNAEKEEYHSRIWSQIQGNISVRPKRLKMPSVLKYAAAVAVILIVFKMVAPPQINPLVARVDWDTIQSFQEMREVTLPDGSSVWLNTGTTICYASDFDNPRHRLVKLKEGEAVFDVTHDEDRPFYVQSSKIKVRVLGTRFMVTDYDELEEAKVTVERGKVQVNDKHHELAILTKGQAVQYNSLTKTVTNEKSHSWFDPENRSVLLDDCSFEEFAMRLHSSYDVEVKTMNSKVKNYRFTGEMYLDEPLDITLYKFCAIHSSEYSIEGKEVIIE